MTTLADIGLLQAFVAVADARSFSDGASRIGLTRSAAGKAIARLEELLGARLLHWTTRQVGLTADGQAFHEKASQILADLEEAQTMVTRGGAKPRGVLRVTATEAFGRQIVLPILGEYLERWPELSAEASFIDRITDIVEEGFDIAIRFGAAPASSDLIARVVARSVGQLCASPALSRSPSHTHYDLGADGPPAAAVRNEGVSAHVDPASRLRTASHCAGSAGAAVRQCRRTARCCARRVGRGLPAALPYRPRCRGGSARAVAARLRHARDPDLGGLPEPPPSYAEGQALHRSACGTPLRAGGPTRWSDRLGIRPVATDEYMPIRV